jgi:hypothetical protein
MISFQHEFRHSGSPSCGSLPPISVRRIFEPPCSRSGRTCSWLHWAAVKSSKHWGQRLISWATDQLPRHVSPKPKHRSLGCGIVLAGCVSTVLPILLPKTGIAQLKLFEVLVACTVWLHASIDQSRVGLSSLLWLAYTTYFLPALPFSAFSFPLPNPLSIHFFLQTPLSSQTSLTFSLP